MTNDRTIWKFGKYWISANDEPKTTKCNEWQQKGQIRRQKPKGKKPKRKKKWTENDSKP